MSHLPGNSAGALFGMVIRNPFKGCWWPPTGGFKGHFESLGLYFASVFVDKNVFIICSYYIANE